MTLTLISDLTVVSIAFLVGCLAVVACLLLAKRAVARRDARNFNQGMRRLTQNEIDCATPRA